MHSLRRRGRRGTRRTKSRKKLSLEQSWDSLQFFSKTNLGRQLNQEHATKVATFSSPADFASPTDNVHFVNIIEDDLMSTTDLAGKRGGGVNAASVKSNQPLFQIKEVVENSDGSLYTKKSSQFVIPSSPKGRKLTINILSTWGDPYYVGLNGIEVFDSVGHRVKLTNPDKQLWADPESINVLQEYDDDPRTVDKLWDGVNFTCDDMHAWMAPFTSGSDHFIHVEFDHSVSLSMLRIWNYNKSRIHSYRGARYVEIALDDTFIFKGDIPRAPGTHSSPDSCCKCICFTKSDSVLRMIERYDDQADATMKAKQSHAKAKAPVRAPKAAISWLNSDSDPHSIRPTTAGQRGQSLATASAVAAAASGSGAVVAAKSGAAQLGSQKVTLSPLMIGGKSKQMLSPLVISAKPLATRKSRTEYSMMPAPARRPRTAAHSTFQPMKGQVLELQLGPNWGDRKTIGMTGFEVVNPVFTAFKVTPDMVTCTPDSDGVGVLVDGNNMHTNDAHMWTESFNPKWPWAITITIDMLRPVLISGLKVWNYNASREDSYQGVKWIRLFLDGKLVGPEEGTVTRKAPGVSTFDYGQFVPLNCIATDKPDKSASGDAPDVLVLGEAEFGSERPAEHLSGYGDSEAKANKKKSKKKSSKSVSFGKAEFFSDAHRRVGITPVVQQYETPLFPSGCMLKLVLLRTWGDSFYIGLNGIELYDERDELVPISKECIEAIPRDINSLPESSGDDPRTLDKLYDGVYNTYDDEHMWLAPYKPDTGNVVFIYFDEPITISCIRLWNYSKTPMRGVSEFEIMVDDHLIYRGVLRQATLPRGSNSSAPDLTQSVLFTDDTTVIERERSHISSSVEDTGGGVVFIDENERVDGKRDKGSGSAMRPTTSAGHKAISPSNKEKGKAKSKSRRRRRRRSDIP